MFQQWWERLRLRFTHFRSDRDLQDELLVHAELEAEEYRAAGASEEEARRLARLAGGHPQVIVEKVRDQEWLTSWEGWYRDLIGGLRAIRKNPVFFATAVLTLALGIGASTAIFSLLYGLVLRSLPTHAPAELVEVGLVSPAEVTGVGHTFISYPMLTRLRSSLTAFTDLSGWRGDQALLPDREGTLHAYSAALVTGNAFTVVPLQPYLGRLLAPSDDMRGGPAAGWPVVLSYRFWSDHYGQDPAIVGQQIRISGTPATVVGILPASFHGVWPGSEIELYLPLQFANVLAQEDVLNQPRSLYEIAAIGRLRPGVSIAQAQAELSRFRELLLTQYIPTSEQHTPFFERAYMRVASVRSGLPTYITHVYAKPLYLMQALVGIVLLLCCVNVGGLLMAKVYARQREFAVRTALGASAGRLVRQYLTESFLLAAIGSALGGFLAWRSGPVLLFFFRDPMMGQPMEVYPDHSLLLASGFLALLTTFLLGALPAWRAGRADPGELLKSRTSLGGKRRIAGRLFIPLQVALSLVLVVLAALLSQSVLLLRSERTGFDTDHVTIQTSPLYLLKMKAEAKLQLYQRMVDRLREMPGVHAAAVASRTPLTGEPVYSRFQAVGAAAHSREIVSLAFNDVSPGYFPTMKIRLVGGREFTPADRALDVCILNQAAAAFLFPQQPALGQYVRARDEQQFPAGTACRVIGIAADAKFSDVRQGPPPTIYFPVSVQRFEEHIGVLVFLINADQKQTARAAFRQTLSELAPTVPLVTFVTLREQMDAALGSQELITLLSNFFGAMALLLSALGLYALLSASVAQRTGEIGLRMAVGADRWLVIRMILREAWELLGWGLLAGVVVLGFATHFVAAMLHGVSRFDPLTLGAVILVLLGVTTVAALVPALRAASLDPTEALRAE